MNILHSTTYRGREERFCHAKLIVAAILTASFLVSSLLTGCRQKTDGTEEQLTETVDSFAYHYFNYHLAQVLRFCTPESEKWLRFVASNIRQADVDLLRAQEDEAEIVYDLPEVSEGDTLVNVHLTVSNHLVKDSIGQAGHFAGKEKYAIPVVKRQGRWVVNLSQQPSPIK